MSDRQARDVRDVAAWISDRCRLSTSFGDIAYVDRGEGAAALFLHGFPLNGFQWRGAIALLSEVRRCLAPDLLGLGYTDTKAGRSLASADQLAMLIEFLDGLGLDRVDIVANDSSTGVAQLFAACQPARVRSLLLTNGDVETDSPPPALEPIVALGRAGRFADEVVVPNLADATIAQSPQGLGGLLYADPANLTDAARNYYLAPLVASPERKALANAFAAAHAPNPLVGIERDLREFRGPVRIVWGMEDVFFSKDSPSYLDRIFPNSRGVRTVAHAKLFFPEEQPDVIAEEARNLWVA